VFNVFGKVYPSVLAFLIDRERRSGEGWFCEGADRYDNATFVALDSVVNRSTAGWAEIEHGLAAFVSSANVRLRLALDCYSLAAKARLSSKDAASSTLAREAVAD
jgi:hypothetical protein